MIHWVPVRVNLKLEMKILVLMMFISASEFENWLALGLVAVTA